MRQSGLSEQFFALIKLALELNVSPNKFSNIQPMENDEHTLIEYEEVILKSGLPMNEIWLRIEKLRQNFYFLPCPENRLTNDPQRMIYNEDIVHFVYPLANKEYSFNLVIIILKLLKCPLPGTSLQLNFLTRQEHCWEFDSIEDIIATFLTKPFLHSSTFDAVLYDFIKDFSIGPSYITIHLGHEIYAKVLIEFLMVFSECFELPIRKNIFLLLWLQFERVLICLDKLTGKSVIVDETKKLRSKIKNLLKREENQNSLLFYTEYALIEYELGNFDKMEQIFCTAIGQTTVNDDDYSRSEYYAAHIAYVEILMRERNYHKAIIVLTNLALNKSELDLNEDIGDPKKLLALKNFSEKLKNLIFIERNVDIMELEQCIMPDYLINLIKAKIYYILMVKTKVEAIDEVEILLKTFVEKNNRHCYVREKLFELYANIVQLPNKHGHQSNLLLFNVLERGLQEYPNNVCLMRMTATIDGQVSKIFLLFFF